MIITIIQNNLMSKMHINSTSGNYQIRDNYNTVVGNFVFADGKWIFNTNGDYAILLNGQETVNSAVVEMFTNIELVNLYDNSRIQVYFYLVSSENLLEVEAKNKTITVGKGSGNDIVYASPYMQNNQYKITYDGTSWYLETIDGYVFVNDRLVKRKKINHGDIIFSYGLKVVCLSNFLVINNLLKNISLSVNNQSLFNRQAFSQELSDNAMFMESEKEVFNPKEEFQRSPRFRTQLTTRAVSFQPPPVFEEPKTQPLLLTIGPQMTMVVTSLVSLSQTAMNIATSSQPLIRSLPSLLVSIFSLVSSYLWPFLTNRYAKRQARRDKILRIKSYKKYLENKDKELASIVEEQKQILIENNVSLETCQDIIYKRRRTLWEKTLYDQDFLSVRIGTGMVEPAIDMGIKEEDFSTSDSDLMDDAKSLVKKYKFIPEMPLTTSFLENRVTAVVGNRGLLKSFFESVLLQIMTFQIYSELKIMIFTDESKVKDWTYMKFAPYCWDNGHQTRFIASTSEERKKLSNYLEQIIKDRSENAKDNVSYTAFKPYYLIITDNIESTRNLPGIAAVLGMGANLGFSIIIKNDRIANLPNQCSSFIYIDEDKSGIFKNDLRIENQSQFKADFNKTVNVEDCVKELSNIYVNIPLDKHELPKSVGFLDMYGVGNVEQLNSFDRWQENNPVNSLAVPVGIDQSGELFYMDIHEKVHGPHGLVAGTTGSGKSEWIITYILSLAINFSPEEVQFVLIDYKGGGLAGSFDNKETGMHLPHLVGTITNLDKSEIRRSLASLDAESKRRQQMFNDAREKLNDSSMNIYKYQQYYRKGMLEEPLSHLLIISDEFAELKQQEPEFLEKLVSIARIGRSLGIHLILATQKPAGVVDEQMWSNSRFKVCLRVQDKADSNDMLKVPDAAFLHQTGAFYFQVGLNEVFALGQSAYSGAKYKPTNVVKKKIETSLDELLNIILYISSLNEKHHFNIRKLWLDALPGEIYVDSLKKKYPFERTPFEIKPIIGEYDNPYKQSQGLLQLNLNEGNIYITGMSGSGKEMLLQSLIYSTITNYTPQEVSLYLLDFGAETFSMFETAPHVGGVAFQSNIDKIENTFRFAWKEYRRRRKEYREFGGNYESFIKYSKKKDSLLVFIINNVDNFKELLPDTFDSLEPLFKECAKYGIIFIVSSIDKNGLKSKMQQSFVKSIAMKQSDDDYSSVIGKSARGITIKDLKGRGLIELDGVAYEFQASTIITADKLVQTVKAVCDQLIKYYKNKAIEIPMIPPTINMNSIDATKINKNKICVGYSKSEIAPYYFDFQKNFGTLILAPKRFVLTEYVKVLYKELETLANDTDSRVYLFDGNDMLKSERYTKIKYVPIDEIKNTYNNLKIYVNGEYEKYQKLDNKNEYKAPRRSLIVLHEASSVTKILESDFDDFMTIVDYSRELGLFDFVVADTASDFKDIARDKGIQKILMDSHGVLIGNTYESQTSIDINSKDIKVKDALPENMGYIVQNGKGVYSQILQYTEVEKGDEDEV